MNSNVAIIILLQILLVCAPQNSQATALDRGQDPEQLWDIGGELSQDSFNHRDALRVKNQRQARPPNPGRTRTSPQRVDLLQELLTAGGFRTGPQQMLAKTRNHRKIKYKCEAWTNGLLQDLVVE